MGATMTEKPRHDWPKEPDEPGANPTYTCRRCGLERWPSGNQKPTPGQKPIWYYENGGKAPSKRADSCVSFHGAPAETPGARSAAR